jgi:hypothetical protein
MMARLAVSLTGLSHLKLKEAALLMKEYADDPWTLLIRGLFTRGSD